METLGDTLRLSKPAATHIEEYLAREGKTAIRIAVVRTHCMGGRGYSYHITMEDLPAPTDVVLNPSGTTVYVDHSSLALLKRAEIDYITTVTEAGFKINNPNAISKCPCGRHDIFERSTGQPHSENCKSSTQA